MSTLEKILLTLLVVVCACFGFEFWRTNSILNDLSIKHEILKKDYLALEIQLQETKEKTRILLEQNDQLKGDNRAVNSVLQDAYKEIEIQASAFTSIDTSMLEANLTSLTQEGNLNDTNTIKEKTIQSISPPTPEQIKITLINLNSILSDSR